MSLLGNDLPACTVNRSMPPSPLAELLHYLLLQLQNGGPHSRRQRGQLLRRHVQHLANQIRVAGIRDEPRWSAMSAVADGAAAGGAYACAGAA